MSKSKRLIRLLLATAAWLLPLSAQTVALSYNPVTAQYSTVLDRLITVSGNPNTLHVYDPVAQQDSTVPLTQPPLSLSLSPDGVHAAVGHDALISYVNLSTLTVEKTYTVPVTAGRVVLSATWIYVMPTYEGGSVSVNLASGTVTNNSSVFYGSGGWLNTAVNAIYGTQDGLSPNDLVEYNIPTGPITTETGSPYHGDYCIQGPLWFSPDGSHVYTGCGTIFHTSTNPNLDRYYLSTLPGVSSVGAFSESTALKTVALISGAPVYPATTTNDGVVTLFDDVYFQPQGQFTLQPFRVNGATFAAHGKWLFYNAASTQLIAIMQADSTSGLLNSYAVEQIPLNTIPAACGAVFATPSASIPATGSTGSVNITAPANCIYQATNSATWIQLVSGALGSGNGTLAFWVQSNSGSSARSTSISLAGQTFVINQAAASAAGPLSVLSYNVVDAGYDKPLDKLVLVSASPNQLHIYNPNANSEQIVPLIMAPFAVSVSPDGSHAAVGHDGWVSYINLQNAAVEKTVQVVTDVHHVLLAGNGYMYLFPERDWSDIYSLQISSGTVTGTSAIYDGRVPRLYEDGNYMYLGGDWFSKWNISQGVATLTSSNSGLSTCGNLWLTEDGRRLVTACATVYTTSDVPAQDLEPNGTLSNATALVWADESSQQHLTAVIPQSSNTFGTASLTAGDTQVQIYGDNTLGYSGGIPLPPYSVGGNSFPAHGKFVFWNQNETALCVVTQADASANLPAGTAVVLLSPAAALLPNVTSVVNGATEQPGRIAPGEIVSIYGTGLGPTPGASFTIDPVTNLVTFNLSGTQVYFGSQDAPVLYASATQVNAVVPDTLTTSGPITIQVGTEGILSISTSLTVASAIPGIFTVDGSGGGQAIAVNQDGTICDSNHPAAPGSYVTIYFTGGGYLDPSATTGSVTGSVLRRLTQTAAVTVGGQPATVSFAGAAPYFVDGVGQLNIQLANNAPAGPSQPVILTVGINSSPATATIAVQ